MQQVHGYPFVDIHTVYTIQPRRAQFEEPTQVRRSVRDCDLLAARPRISAAPKADKRQLDSCIGRADTRAISSGTSLLCFSSFNSLADRVVDSRVLPASPSAFSKFDDDVCCALLTAGRAMGCIFLRDATAMLLLKSIRDIRIGRWCAEAPTSVHFHYA